MKTCKKSFGLKFQSLWLNVSEAKKRIAVQATTVQSAERSYAITRSRRQQGIGSQLELTDAELSLNQAKVNYLQAVYDYLVATANLEKHWAEPGAWQKNAKCALCHPKLQMSLSYAIMQGS
ncbi:MAG: hypothetical protein CMR00_03995 [[Chlorobium] sp. 445]|nr:MAG: hypothetical protein CMR00_03995 [[Chlorobium] sp. 445]